MANNSHGQKHLERFLKGSPMPATKNAPVARKNAKKAPAAKAPAAKRVAKQVEPTPVVQAQNQSRNMIGRLLQEAMTKQLLTIPQLAAKVGVSEKRAEEHVAYEVSKSRSRLNTKRQVVVLSQPIRRNAS